MRRGYIGHIGMLGIASAALVALERSAHRGAEQPKEQPAAPVDQSKSRQTRRAEMRRAAKAERQRFKARGWGN